MSNLFLTLVIAFVIIVFAIALLAIGWLITGKTKIDKGCELDPTKKKDDKCHTHHGCTSSPSSQSTTHMEKQKTHSSHHS